MYGHCIVLVRWIKSAALAPKLFTCNPSPKGVILPHFFCVFVPKGMGNGASPIWGDGEVFSNDEF